MRDIEARLARNLGDLSQTFLRGVLSFLDQVRFSFSFFVIFKVVKWLESHPQRSSKITFMARFSS